MLLYKIIISVALVMNTYWVTVAHLVMILSLAVLQSLYFSQPLILETEEWNNNGLCVLYTGNISYH